MTIIIKRWEIILILIVSILTGGIYLTSKDSDKISFEFRWPYRVALTFDDGPHIFFTEEIVKILKDENIPATFFLVGKNIEKYPHLAQLISSNGHQIGNHTYSHKRLTQSKESEIIEEVKKMEDVLEKTIGKKTNLFRPPGGHIDESTEKLLKKRGYKIVYWDVFPNDINPDITADEIYKRVIDSIKDNSIILLHSGSKNTLNALPKLIKALKMKGYRFVRVSELRG